MSNRKAISQREARELKRRVFELETMENRRLAAWAEAWPGGVNIATLTIPDATRAAVRTARLLKHAVVVTLNDDGSLRVHALPLGGRQ